MRGFGGFGLFIIFGILAIAVSLMVAKFVYGDMRCAVAECRIVK